jgi:hypothetical protein
MSYHIAPNRHSTLFLYFNDLAEGTGGHTVFPHTIPPSVEARAKAVDQKILDKLIADGQHNHPHIRHPYHYCNEEVTCFPLYLDFTSFRLQLFFWFGLLTFSIFVL